ncbi:MAG: recombinase family protein [Bifidobacteriaceae bacterium]|jgi:DNA invertase Pin-like site-specific DNA recombinase|nr:recombinase family protein [Bifidobacteriaceae bacterium]
MTADVPLGSAGRALAVVYLRVSTKEQAQKGGSDEGYSIPAQRAANLKKADEIGALVVEEFVDAGESARKADGPELRRMLEFVAEHKIAYCIVHKIDRLARNRADDVAIHLALRDAGVVLVSATENIDETLSGMLMHGIMSTIAEFYSRNLATEVVKGLTQKAKAGGTPRKAPIGCVNVRGRDFEGRRVSTVELDPERGPLISWAFKAYASGNWTVLQLRDELTRRGLTTLPTPKHPSKPVSKSCVYKILANRYYKGDVVYRDQVYKGTHERLVAPEVFLQVQAVLAGHSKAAVRERKHDHYLKGILYCGGCGSRLILVNAKSHTGERYPYFVCCGRQNRTTDCRMRAIPTQRAGEALARWLRDGRKEMTTRHVFHTVIRPGFGGGGLSRNWVVRDVQELSVVGLLVLYGWDVSDG